MSSDDSPIEDKENLPSKRSEVVIVGGDNFSPVENMMIGNTEVFKGATGKSIDKKDILELLSLMQKGDRSALYTLLTPVALQKSSKTLEQVQEQREKIDKKRLIRGLTWSIFDAQSKIKIFRAGKYQLSLGLAHIDKEGNIIPNWRVYIVEGDQIVSNSELLAGLKVSDEFQKYFILLEQALPEGSKEPENYRVLKLRTE